MGLRGESWNEIGSDLAAVEFDEFELYNIMTKDKKNIPS